MPYSVELLDAVMRVLMYSSDRDLACNFLGTEELLSSGIVTTIGTQHLELVG